MAALGIFGAVWGVVTLALFVWAIRLCYAVERRSYPEKFENSLPRRANMFAVALNTGSIARDTETQMLRRKMNRLLIVIAILFAVMALSVMFALPASP